MLSVQTMLLIQKSVFLLKNFDQNFLYDRQFLQCVERSGTFFIEGSINAERYVKEGLQKRLLPLIRKYKGPIVAIVFWPDLTTCFMEILI